MKNKFNARGTYWCLQCHGSVPKLGKSAICQIDKRHKVVYFSSKKELRRYNDLWLLQKAGEIFGLEPHPAYEIAVHGVKIGNPVKFDFRYVDIKRGATIVEDTKGDTKGRHMGEWNLRRKLVEALYGIKVEVV